MRPAARKVVGAFRGAAHGQAPHARARVRKRAGVTDKNPRNLWLKEGLSHQIIMDCHLDGDADSKTRLMAEGTAMSAPAADAKTRHAPFIPPRSSVAAAVDVAYGRFEPASDVFHLKMVNSFPVVQSFIQGTIVYIVSQEMQDLLAIFVFELHPMPYCGTKDFMPCTPEKPPWAQATYALVLLISLTLLQIIAARYEARFEVLTIFPSMARAIAGWALANTFQRMVAESEPLLRCGACDLLHFSAAVLTTLFSAAMTLVVQPLTLVRCLGNGAAEELLRTGWELLLKALSWTQMMLWTDALNKLIVSGASAAEMRGVLLPRLLALWALALTSIFSVLTIRLCEWRQYLTDNMPEPSEDVSVRGDGEAPWRRKTVETPVAAAPAAPPPPPPPPPRRASAMHEGGLSYRTTLLQTLALMEGTLGWVSGCAWTNAVVAAPFMPPPWEFPDALRCVQHGASAAALTVLAVVWLVASGSTQSLEEQFRSNRDHVERFYLTNGMSFFVGFSWVLFIRALRANMRAALMAATGWQLLCEVFVVAVFGPALVIAAISAKSLSLQAYAKGGGFGKGKLRSILMRAVVADGSELNPRTVRKARVNRLHDLLGAAAAR